MTNYVSGEFVVAWIMNWNIHAITSLIWPFFDANIFYPYHNTLAYSDLLLSSSILAMPFFMLFHEPELPSNITFLSSLILLGFFSYLLVFYITKNFLASILSGLLIIFSPVVLDKRYHLQILAIEWVPLTILFFIRFIYSKKYKFLIFSLLCFIIQTYNSFMPGYFLIISYIGIIISFFVFQRKTIMAVLTKKTLFLFILSFFLILPITIPYFQVSHQFHFVRDIRETIHLALQPEDLLVTNDLSRLKPILSFFDNSMYPKTAEIKPGFLGLVFTLLTLFSIGYGIKVFKYNNHKSKNALVLTFLGTGLFGLILSLGPALHLGRLTIHHPFLIPLPYGLFYYLLPGFQGIRDSSRFEMLFVLFMAIAIGIVIDKVLKNRSTFAKLIIYMIILVGIIGEFTHIPFEKTYTFENFPPVYSWIRKHTPKNAVIAEVPIYNWDNNPFGDNREVLREYFSTIHFRKLISGGSGFSPPPWQEFAKYEFNNFPLTGSVEKIKKYGANYLIVHADEFEILNRENYKAGSHVVWSSNYVINNLSQNQSLQFVVKEGNSYVYKFK